MNPKTIISDSEEALKPWRSPEIQKHSLRLIHTFKEKTGQALLTTPSANATIAEALYNAPFIILSHNTNADPIFNYANRAAQTLWETDWTTLTNMPSRLSAEPVHQKERARLLSEAAEKGFINNYEGIRITSNGKRFRIKNAIIWNLSNGDGSPAGQAATFNEWTFL